MREESRKAGENFAKLRKKSLVKEVEKIANESSGFQASNLSGGSKFLQGFEKLRNQEKMSYSSSTSNKLKNRFTNLLKSGGQTR